MKIEFARSEQSTLGLEWEIALVDPNTGELTPGATQLLENVEANDPAVMKNGEHPNIKGEMLQNTVELVTGVSHTVSQGVDDLRRSLEIVREAAKPLDVDLMSAGTHPFSNPRTQPVTEKERYAKLVERTQWWGSQMLIYGVHVHVGLDNVAKAMPVVDGLVNYFPHFQALSASSPFWNGEDTGYASQRALMFQQLPTAGLPFQFPDWESYEAYVADMFTTGVIDVVNEIRWDIRPVAALGTVEMRICDGMSSLDEIGAVAALTQCLVDDFSTTLDNGGKIPTMPPWHIQENKWRAARYGLDAIVILDAAGKEQLVTDNLIELLNKLEPTAAKLGCSDELAGVERIIQRGAGYQRQREVAAANGGDLQAVVKSLVAEMAAN